MKNGRTTRAARATGLLLAPLAAAAIVPAGAAAVPVAPAGEPCTQLHGAAHIGALGPGTQHLDLRLELSVAAPGPQTFTWRETNADGSLRMAGSRFVLEAASCVKQPGGFVFDAQGSALLRLGPRDTRQAAIELLVEEHEGATTIAIGGRPALGAQAAPAASLPLSAPAPARGHGAALSAIGPRGRLNRNSLHAA